MGIGTETETEIDQPVESVADDAEVTEGSQQPEAKEEIEVYVEESDDQEDSHKMSQQQAYAAFQREKEKRKRKNAELEEMRQQLELRDKRLQELEETVGTIARGKRPDPYDFDSTDEFYAALEKWQGSARKQAPEETKPAVKPQSNPEAEFYLFQKERELTKLLPDYEKSKAELAEKLENDYGVNPDAVFNMLSGVAMHGDTDIAKAFFAMNKNPSILDELNAATNQDGTPNQIKWAKILDNAAKRVKTRTTKPVDAQPEPEITSTGSVDVTSKAVEKAREKWVANPTTANFKAYQSAKSKLKVKDNG